MAAPAWIPGDLRRLSTRNRDRLIAALYGVLSAFLLTSEALTGRPPVPGWQVVTIVAATVVLMRYRRRPVLTTLPLCGLVAVTLWFHAGLLAFALIFEMVFAASLYGTRWVRWTAAGLALALMTVYTVTEAPIGFPPEQLIFWVVQIVLLVGLALNWGDSLRRAKQAVDAEAALRAVAEAKAELAETNQRLVVAGDRARLARDMHDIVAGRLAAIYLQAGLGGRRAPPDSQTRALLKDIETCSSDTLEEVRRLISVLNSTDEGSPGTGLPQPPARAAATRLERLVGSAGLLGADLTLDDDLPCDDHGTGGAAAAEALYLIAHEAVANVIRHGSPCRGAVHLTHRDGCHLLTVWNTLGRQHPRPGTGSDHRGRGNMTARAAAQGGAARSGPSPDGRVWVVRAAVPAGPDARIPRVWLDAVPKSTGLTPDGTQV